MGDARLYRRALAHLDDERAAHDAFHPRRERKDLARHGPAAGHRLAQSVRYGHRCGQGSRLHRLLHPPRLSQRLRRNRHLLQDEDRHDRVRPGHSRQRAHEVRRRREPQARLRRRARQAADDPHGRSRRVPQNAVRRRRVLRRAKGGRKRSVQGAEA